MMLRDIMQEIPRSDVIGPVDIDITGLTYDSRKVESGFLFAALTGTRYNGMEFFPQALENGAKALLCSPPVPDEIKESCTVITSARPRETLGLMASLFYGRPSRQMVVVGVTGTNGKTTITFLLESIARAAGIIPGVTGTITYRYKNNELKARVTTPESVDLHRIYAEMRDGGVGLVASEVSSHALVQARVEGVDFSAGVFTNLSQDHLDYHKDMESYLQAKRILFNRYLPASKGPKGPLAVFCVDSEAGVRLADDYKGEKVTCASAPNARADVFVTGASLDLSGITCSVNTPWGELELQSKLLGSANLQNIVTAAGTALALGISRDAVTEGIRSLQVVPGRMEIVSSGRNGPVVVVDYAHSPDAIDKALAALRRLTHGRLIAVFGCGGDRDREKRPLMGAAVANRADLAIVTSDNPRTEAPAEIIGEILPGLKGEGAVHAAMEELFSSKNDNRQGKKRAVYTMVPDRADAIRFAITSSNRDDLVAILGKGHEDYQIVGDKRTHLDDREQAAIAIKEMGKR
ncbi:MAG: UDP-N-acetylmuramoyl-L-alanyl-D-glutamate--2,6-diaminopimelate ligase [Deltaproteobacteria bacterium]|nr:UDP-N-acetylmuramoyl-L-alanyl-D-glutamate--2,6-diaminopimelate ligase [Deltaproteobacteria bacterium]